MCGIFGIAITDTSNVSAKEFESTVKSLFTLSESRGKEASGLAVLSEDSIDVLKSPFPASRMIRTPGYNDFFDQFFLNGPSASENRVSIKQPIALIGHTRLATTGSQELIKNNQPVIAGKAVGIHNGIIVNHGDIWRCFPDIQRHYQVDSEIIFSLIRMFYDETGVLMEAVQKTFEQIKGTASIAVMFEDFDLLLLATNNGSLYRCVSNDGNAFIFASERYILKQLIQRSYLKKDFDVSKIKQIVPGQGCFVNITNLSVEEFQLKGVQNSHTNPSRRVVRRQVTEVHDVQENKLSLTSVQRQVGLSNQTNEETIEYLDTIKRRFPYNTSWQDSLQRCSKCVLPETMPFIAFDDDDGVCSYCRYYKKLEYKGRDKLEEVVSRYRSRSNTPDCVVGISGGRDSLYCLHYIKNVLHMNPIAYTYDWGMVTDLARRNNSRICGKLGIEHILVSADINKKRNFIKKNVTAWLQNPALGMIPIFMAGDKQYFYYHYQVRKQLGVELAIQGENMLERTDFKSGFAGVRPYTKDPHHSNTLPIQSSLRLAAYYGKKYFCNPSYINTSLLDTLFAYACYYIIDRSYLNLYAYIPWVESEVVSTLIDRYDFELSTDSTTTWRIGDGTAAFYNYIYHTVAGFTENDTFRSNQIREGLITREEAMKRVYEENKPRYESIYWYLNIIGLDVPMDKVLEIISVIPKVNKTSK